MFMLVFLMLGLNICYLRNGGCIFGEEWLCKDEEKEEKIPQIFPPGVTGGRRWSTATQSVAGQSMASHQSLHTNEHGWMGMMMMRMMMRMIMMIMMMISFCSETRKISFVLQEQSQVMPDF